MKWETPAASDMRFGFEITMYIANRYGVTPGRCGARPSAAPPFLLVPRM